MHPLDSYLKPTKYVIITPEIKELAEKIIEGSKSRVDAAIKIFNFVQNLKFGASSIYTAPDVLKNLDKPLICVSKAILQVALYRSIGIPSRFHTWKVILSEEIIAKINDLLFSNSTKKFKGNRVLYHVAAEVYLDRWIVADATLDKGLSKIFNVPEWNGHDDYFLNGFKFLEDLGVSEKVPKIVIDIISGKNLPVYLKILYPILAKKFNKKLNALFEKIREDC